MITCGRTSIATIDSVTPFLSFPVRFLKKWTIFWHRRTIGCIVYLRSLTDRLSLPQFLRLSLVVGNPAGQDEASIAQSV